MGFAYPEEGGCWYCNLVDNDLIFCYMFDTFVHADCVRKMAMHSSNEEALLIADDIGVILGRDKRKT